MSYWLRTFALLPVLAAQAISARRRALILPEAAGERSGVTGTGPSLRLLISGDSAAAGVGAKHQDQALLGQLVSALSDRHTVRWRLEARSGATTQSTIAHLMKQAADDVDVATTSLGVNDITSGVGLRQWLARQAELRDLLRARFRCRLILVAGLPPVHLFPGLPQPLRWHLGLRARQFDSALAQQLANEPDCAHVPLNVSDDASEMAEDGFHPGPSIYSLWAGLVAEEVQKSFATPRMARHG
ncbi:MAG: SGNH/GDSL hydrolase family protein [Gammaproteobacteria bacterium]|nr:SGNH/GDSL hydrolase family protein [Gammaproteobacteria bacterium]